MIPTMRILFLGVLALAVLFIGACSSTTSGKDESASSIGAPATAPPPIVIEREVVKEVPVERLVVVEKAVIREVAKRAIAVDAPVPAVVADASMATDEAVAASVSQQRIIVRTLDIKLVVPDISASLSRVTDLARGLGGWVVSSNVTERHAGFISVRVPADRLDDAVQSLRDMAVEVDSEVSTSRDVTDEYVDIQARLRNLQATETALLKLFEKAEKVEDALKVQQSLTQVQGDIERLQGRVKFLEQTAAFSLINVILELKPAEMPLDAGDDTTSGVGHVVRFRATFRPPDGIDEFTYTWDFGDGSRVISSNRTAPTKDEGMRVTATVTHQYHDEKDSPFFAEIRITGTGEAGLAEGEDTLIVTVTRVPAIEVFAGESMLVDQGQEVEVSGSFTRPEGVRDVRYKWDFGDGSPPATGGVDTGVTNVTAVHAYPDHRPFPFTATLTIIAQSDAGEVETSSSLQVFVEKSQGWTLAGWSAGDASKSAVRALSGVGQGIAFVAIWGAIFSPVWITVGIVGVIARRRMKVTWPRSRRDAA